jgi:hypothetical protein
LDERTEANNPAVAEVSDEDSLEPRPVNAAAKTDGRSNDDFIASNFAQLENGFPAGCLVFVLVLVTTTTISDEISFSDNGLSRLIVWSVSVVSELSSFEVAFSRGVVWTFESSLEMSTKDDISENWICRMIQSEKDVFIMF